MTVAEEGFLSIWYVTWGLP